MNFSLDEQLISVSKEEWELKSEMAAKQLPISCPIIPCKIRRPLVLSRNLFTTYGKARAIAVRNDGMTPPLSPLYNRRTKKSYLDQLFDIRTKVGEGSFGNVFKAKANDDKKYYAIKHLKENLGTRASKKREIMNYRRIGSNEHFVNFIRAWEEHDKIYIQMEFCLMSLADFANQHNYIPPGQLWDILTDMLLALKHLHDMDFIHLDIKPENILISKTGVYKLGDFGLVVNLKELSISEGRVLNLSDGDSKYLASEVLDRVYTKACDVFSLGVTLLELSTDLVLPPSGCLWHELRNGVFPPVFFQRVSRDMATLIQQMMLFDYKKRPSVDDLLKTDNISTILQKRKIFPRINYIKNNDALHELLVSSPEEEGTAALPNANIENAVQMDLANEEPEVEEMEEQEEEETDIGVAPLLPSPALNSRCSVRLTFENAAPSTSRDQAPESAESHTSAIVSTPKSGRESRLLERLRADRAATKRKAIRAINLNSNLF